MNCHRSPVRGFSTLELMIVLTLIMIVAGMALLNSGSAVPNMRANAAMNQVVSQLRLARESSIAQRRNYQIIFSGTNQIQLRRLEVPSGNTDFPPITLTAPVQFNLFSGIPDTPDGFGNSRAVSFGGTLTVQFLSDGTFTDTAGIPLNGSVFIGIPNQLATARTITVLGTTCRVSSYRWDGSQWLNLG